ncbi:MAG: hypothetical protein QM808_15265 [Steroidobacteraceae bacterium]
MQQEIIAWMADTRIAHFMGDWQWAWPWGEAIHFIGMSLLFGSIMIMDLRLIGFMRKEISLHAVHALTGWGLLGFSLNLITGVAFVMKDAERFMPNVSFWFKMVCIALAGVNFLIFWFVIRKRIEHLPDDADVDLAGKAVGLSSLLLWFLVIWGGRLIPVYGIG